MAGRGVGPVEGAQQIGVAAGAMRHGYHCTDQAADQMVGEAVAADRAMQVPAVVGPGHGVHAAYQIDALFAPAEESAPVAGSGDRHAGGLEGGAVELEGRAPGEAGTEGIGERAVSR